MKIALFHIHPNIITQAQTKCGHCIEYPAYRIAMEEMSALSAAADIPHQARHHNVKNGVPRNSRKNLPLSL
jgi:hypothetical protein